MLILGSASPIRRALLDQAGVNYVARPPRFDEEGPRGELSGAALAQRLAEGKALATERGPDDWAIGGDSTLTVDGRAFSKPRSRDEAAEHLRAFSGREMRLSSAVALARGAAIEWSHVDSARLFVRPLSEPFIQSYLEAEWPAVGGCVGVFRMEGPGVTLFDRVEGDHFTILGLPLLPLLGALRQRGLMAS